MKGKQLYLVHRTGTAMTLPVEWAEASLVPDGFILDYASDEVTVLFLRTEAFDAAILRDPP